MLAPVLAALLGAPADAPPLGPTDESVVYEPPARDPVLEPVEITPPPPRELAEPPSPGWSVEPEQVDPEQVEPELAEPPILPPLDLPPPPPPPTGAGRLVGGSVAIGLALAAASVVIVEGARADGNPQFVATTFVPLSLGSLGLGIYLLVRGARARANFNEWRAYADIKPLPSGDGLIVAGTLGTIIGGVTLVAAGVQSRDPGAFDEPLAPTLYGIGGAGVVAGVGMLTGGLLRRSRYRIWRQSTFLAALPTVAPLRGGVTVGLAGRF